MDDISQTNQVMARHLLVIGLVILISGATSVATAQTANDIHRDLSRWKIETAKEKLKKHKSELSPVDAKLIDARYSFLKGKYERASKLIEQVSANSPKFAEQWGWLEKRIKASHKVTRDYKTATRWDGRIEFAYKSSRDRVLIPYATEAIKSAYEQLGEEFGTSPPFPIRIEIYPSTKTLAQVSGLTESDIRNSGTIALCKFNRLMMTTPRVLVHGYPWVDTLSHEYVHYAIHHATTHQVPIWMHEGLAKYLERAWRGPDSHRLSPSLAHLLSKRLEADDLITLEQMHPSIAKLPSQDDAATAFAQVYTMMEYLDAHHSGRAFEALLGAINEGVAPKEAFARVAGMKFSKFRDAWLADLKQRSFPSRSADSPYGHRLVFRDEASRKSTKSKFKPEEPEVKDFLHLGELLQGQGNCKAAVVEYKKAKHRVDGVNRVLSTQMARCYHKRKKYGVAKDLVEPVTEKFPRYVFSWVELGKAERGLEQYDLAIETLKEAARINPFDPQIHRELKKAYRATNQDKLAEQAGRFEALVKQREQ